MTQQATDFREGDLVEVTKGESVVRGRLRKVDWPGATYLYVGDSADLYKVYIHEGWTVTLIDRPAPKVELPTEPGWYLDRLGSAWVHVEGELRFVGVDGEDPSQYAPFTRLESVTDTAKRVIAAVRKAYHTDDPTYWGNLDRIAREFGVTE